MLSLEADRINLARRGTQGLTTAVLYARYSTDMQSAASAEDQLRLLRQRAEREGWTVISEHADRAISGTVRDRLGLTAALAQIETGHAAVLLAESLDRISRDQEDLAGFFKRIRFHGARIITLSEGEIGAIHIGMGGTMSAMFLEQLADKVRRGHVGRVEAGRIPGGLSYGYRMVRQIGPDGELERGLREIYQDQAGIVRRIFAAYAAGQSPLAIVKALNAEQIPSPRGGLWRANAITGHRQRGNGILHNELYRGRIVYNRQAFRKDPATRRRVARANAAADRVEHDVPELRIIDDALWQQAQARLTHYSDRPSSQRRRPKRLLSGLLRCGCCGGSYILVQPGRWGCSDRKQTGTCTNGTTITDVQAQKRIWAAVQSELLHPDVIAAWLDEARLALAEARRSMIAARADTERRLSAIEGEERRLLDAIAEGIPIEGLRARAEALATERDGLRLSLASQPETLPSIHPGLVEHYRRQIAKLHQLVDADETTREQGRALIADLIEKIEVTPRADGTRGTDLIVHGKLAALLQAPNNNSPTKEGEADCMLAMVAGVGFGRCHTMAFAA